MIGDALRAAGLSPRMLAAWAGTDRLSALPRLASRFAERPVTQPGALLELFVAGRDVPRAMLGAVDIEALQRLGLVEVAADAVRAPVAVLPLGGSLLVCDRLDAPVERDLVCWPDDSSYHLARALPPGRASWTWIDLGCGSAFAPLFRPELAQQVAGVDINPRALRYARLGAELSGLAFTAFQGDLCVPPGLLAACQLVTCNAPIPGSTSLPFWRAGDPHFVDRMLTTAGALVAPGGLVVVHSVLDALEPALRDLPGDRVIVTYTPEGVRGFSIDHGDRVAC